VRAVVPTDLSIIYIKRIGFIVGILVLTVPMLTPSIKNSTILPSALISADNLYQVFVVIVIAESKFVVDDTAVQEHLHAPELFPCVYEK
jgi:hypothetical protein